ncbi:MAG TPA: pilus assembly protein TadG-related protein [Streptosporangiaceae bacterium]|nr:pilus assembly protein TadG-related protein [Streptosporangiaceae bacterium]
MSWSAVIVFAALLMAAVVVVTGYFRGNRKIQAAADAARADTPLTLLRPEAEPERDEKQGQSDSWIWR